MVALRDFWERARPALWVWPCERIPYVDKYSLEKGALMYLTRRESAVLVTISISTASSLSENSDPPYTDILDVNFGHDQKI